MKITIAAYGILRSYLGQNSVTPIEKEFDKPVTVREIAEEMGIPAGMVMLVAANDEQKTFDYVPKDGDEIKLIPPISGG